MVQFNLLPDVKLEYIKARRTKRLVTLLSIVVSGAALAVLLLMVVTVYGVQKKSLSDLNKDIKKYSDQLKAVPDLSKILTVQNQLAALDGTSSKPGLHDQKPVATRLFGYISQLTPPQASISKLHVDYAANAMTITGEAPSLEIINSFTDEIKATTYTKGTVKGEWQVDTSYKAGDSVEYKNVWYTALSDHTASDSNKPSNTSDTWEASPKAFSSVVLSTFGRDSKGATYTITFNFDQQIFNNNSSIALTVPGVTVTSTNTSILFQKQAGN